MVTSTRTARHLGVSGARSIHHERREVPPDIATLVPDRDADQRSLNSLVERKLQQLFHICLRSRKFYLATRGNHAFWQFASEHWDTFGYVSPNEAAIFVYFCVVCHERWSAAQIGGESMQLLGEFMRMHEEMLARGVDPRYRIAIRPSPIYPTPRRNSRRANTSYVSPSTAAMWPPGHFTKQEVTWLCHDHILSQLYGVTSETKVTKAAHFPQIPNAYAHPLDVRLFLAFTALVNFKSCRSTSICMAPITFWDDDERRDWYRATGGAARLCWTTWEFCQWAKKEFRRGREAVAGLCHFHCTTEDEPWKWFEDTYDPSKHDRQDVYWAKTTPRYSVGVLIRRLGKDSYEFVMEDAHYHRVSAKPTYYEDTQGVYANTGMDFKAALLEDVATHFNLTSIWHGGDVPNAFEGLGICLHDTVSSSCSFAFLAAQGKIPMRSLFKEGWDFSRNVPKKMRYWEEQDEKSTEEGITECDDSGSEYCEDR